MTVAGEGRRPFLLPLVMTRRAAMSRRLWLLALSDPELLGGLVGGRDAHPVRLRERAYDLRAGHRDLPTRFVSGQNTAIGQR
ncbi:hypothetical protein [Nocardia asteroides]|uniref:hypothetical protein n=1 Tax=Nocardia asteroides TaxID=1824 RepID=UPI001E64E6D2|nr:hypothetical protein [Nocardia asteroides]UGT58924.1 hypothetical protein LTT85_33090 [Nocardia asteroides]